MKVLGNTLLFTKSKKLVPNSRCLLYLQHGKLRISNKKPVYKKLELERPKIEKLKGYLLPTLRNWSIAIQRNTRFLDPPTLEVGPIDSLSLVS